MYKQRLFTLMRRMPLKISLISLMLLISFTACKKGWLEAKPNQGLVTLNSIKNLQGLLDDNSTFNQMLPGLSETATDDYYVTDSEYMQLTPRRKDLYAWLPASSGPDFYEGNIVSDWDNSYKRIFNANTILEEISKIQPTTGEYTDWANIKGGALFHRAYAFYNLAQIFCKPYTKSDADSDLGIVLRLIPDINEPSVRTTVQKTYDQIIADLLIAKDLLPVNPLRKTLASKPAVLALLARVYLSMEEYTMAGEYADACLQLSNGLLNYNDVDTSLLFPMPTYPQNNPEVIFLSYCTVNILCPTVTGRGFVDSTLLGSYASEDLRRKLFFKPFNNKIVFTGTYMGSQGFVFNGLATDEVYLIRAECRARSNRVTEAMQDVNAVYSQRWKRSATVPFEPLQAIDSTEALRKILLERRKELCFRAIRLTDLRRLNKDPRFKITINRVNNYIVQSLLPDDPRYVFPIPYYEILYSGIQQNPR
jgi:starch-binding outer membrane protein, SusD/RagB family